MKGSTRSTYYAKVSYTNAPRELDLYAVDESTILSCVFLAVFPKPVRRMHLLNPGSFAHVNLSRICRSIDMTQFIYTEIATIAAAAALNHGPDPFRKRGTRFTVLYLLY
jgi:hypothetical protein